MAPNNNIVEPATLGAESGTIERTDAGYTFTPAAPPPERVPDGRTTERQMSQLEAEMNAGKTSVERAQEVERMRKRLIKSQNEIKAEGTSVPVHVPGDFREYANIRQPASSKDGKGSRVSVQDEPFSDAADPQA
jgi:hypothetical protein